MSDDRTDAPADLAQWGLHAFALGARSTPHAVVAMDDNGALLYHARNGITMSELRTRGISASQSQLALLRAYELITIDDEVVTTAFPVIGPDLLGTLRPRIRAFADTLAPRLTGGVKAITTELRRRGHTAHDFTVVFGHAVDGLLWDRLRAHGLVPTTELSVERPYWNGAFWALHPPRKNTAGVNEVPGSAATLVMVWTDATSNALWDFARSDAGQSLLSDPHSQRAVPVLTGADELHHHSLAIADTIARALQSDPEAQALAAALPDTGRHEPTLVLAHELIWDLMTALTETGRLHPQPGPRTLTDHLLLRVPR